MGVEAHVDAIQKTHLWDLIAGAERCKAVKLKEKIEKMLKGEKISGTEQVSASCRAPRDAIINSDGVNEVPEVWSAKDKIKQFSETFKSGPWVGATGKALATVVSVGIGGSFLLQPSTRQLQVAAPQHVVQPPLPLP